ncbi:MAG: 30S ribosomal protein S2 [Candidatus Yonathbacteria bacterium CG10_big_fil_rev_8_21_14_0_10_43_136]|uniref:Small ribosomal subunit protein uS2 n=1 Tax=Candidatus Nomurabacteria bacterium CG2_30_43_9 TaxID=1805283 RepID=A0A1J5GFH1_9BACT|nr:MAG: 30S ribosomal protein S2 [Candidatus Nomurabacteria bacterium CG2_30_43_9]PIQ35576.1 MAG: 30S ribosomal protein S2 [Candidatus Yonathbacteria bacterium CG17_big_fil_post_rev_8_21_14_2_50_43_9]PIR40490.1 MAG: 30S ribosomal protein S2 [Candidatus Yonathbacteria bacterium CG10_big_fil_rev_8_21_14_0_10_43_136]PIX56961.1 MAG: 30S ribosomal protein S2 [Candidatus Yonathbacteria bacterium CG_4_10_14_3_um_filter_43_12]PJC22399.1 MAG: 30S ribosomal protein S2 [Candidatus Yonathbacteria bacterium
MTKTVENKGLITEMFAAGAHFGYSRSRRHPSAKAFIFGTKNGIEIMDLEKTSVELEKAKAFVNTLAKGGKQILFVGTKSESKKVVEDGASSIDMPFVADRWVGGVLTNFPEIKKRVALLEDLRSKKEKGELAIYTKKERSLIDKDIERLERNFAGIVSMKETPAAMFVVDPRKESIAIKEAQHLGIPVVALASSDCNIKEIDFPIPGNDSSVSSVSFFVSQIVDAFKEGRNA